MLSTIGIASTWSNVTPCNMHIVTISDGISMGSEGMKHSLVSREVIADSIETVVGCDSLLRIGWGEGGEAG